MTRSFTTIRAARTWFPQLGGFAMLGALGLLLALPNALALAQEPHPEPAAGGSQSTPAAQSPEKNAQEADENDAYRHSPAVTKFGAMLGMDPERAATVFEVTNFAILAILGGWFLLRALPKTFRNRNTVIQKHLVDARSATEEASTRLNTVEERLGRLDGEIQAMRTRAETDIGLEETRLRAAVEDEKRKILAAAEQEIAAATVTAQRQIQRYAAELAIDHAARKLVVSAETDRLLVQNFARRLAGDDAKEGHN